mmetsp:Transcript_12148/g.35536  ORF Transcript_12148/g.35536 Transcript_12148/m.35536 type:complete len:80 (-) Transcript_12148:574-813(-)|eukprot:CAMPEP_0113526662 /NCGR_PEP_ID=MMETSP0015_2-20120614/871_1 /TAXON_ID=2838 /ORGANISM="Odontella" /LENGTH=79 /DNA_ID=CAMNT_0000425023 /DNA_START=81 /DNA_END=320 /DNA_ORIENTATION=- /assembly_acc=CAM_ASM_000160
MDQQTAATADGHPSGDDFDFAGTATAAVGFKNIKIPLVVLIFVLILVGIYMLIMGLECGEYCKSRKREQYEEVRAEVTV